MFVAPRISTLLFHQVLAKSTTLICLAIQHIQLNQLINIISSRTVSAYNMTQSVGNYFGNPLFFGNRLHHNHRWEKWRTQVKLVILAVEGITIDVLLKPKPEDVILPPVPHQKQQLDDSTEAKNGKENAETHN